MLKKIVIFSLMTMVFAQFDWQDNGIPIRQGIHIEWQRTATSGPNGEIIYVWSDTRSGGRDIFAQKVDENGNLLWGEMGIPIVTVPARQEDPIAISDLNGGIFVIWRDYRNEPEDGDVYAQHMFSDGSFAWDEAGVPLSNLGGVQESLNLCSDGLGGVFALWSDKSSSTDGHITVTHISANDEILAQGTGIPVLANQGSHARLSFENAGDGFAMMVWQDTRMGGEETDIYMQRIDSSCNTIWTTPEEGGIPMCDVQGSKQLAAKITHLSNDTTVVVWEDYRSEGSDNADIYIQFINGDGDFLLEETGFPISNLSHKKTSPRVKASSTTAYFVWEDERVIPNWPDIYAQAYQLGTGILWEEDGKSISALYCKQTQPRLTADNDGAFFIWMDNRNADYPETEIFLQHISNDGTEMFETNGLSICEAPSLQFSPVVRKDNNGGAFTVWGDSRTGSIDLFVNHVDATGTTFEIDGLDTFVGMDGNAINLNSLYLGNDRTLLYWEDLRSGGENPRVYGQIVHPGFDPISGLNGVLLGDNPIQTNPQAILMGENIFFNFITHGEWGEIQQYYLVLDSDLNAIGDINGNIVHLNDFGYNQSYSSIAYGKDGYTYLAYSDMYWDYDIFLQKYDEQGNPQWDGGGIAVTTEGNDQYTKTIEPLEDGGVIVVWEGGDGWIFDIFVQGIDGNGNIAEGWSTEPINVAIGDGDQLAPKSIYTPTGTFIAWHDNRDGNGDIYGQFISHSGQVLGNESGFSIVSEAFDQVNPTLAYHEDLNEIMVCWEDRRNDLDWNIYCKQFNIDTFELNDEFALTQLPEDQLSPDVFVALNGNYMFAWEDSRMNVGSDVYFQEMKDGEFEYEENGIIVCNRDFPQQFPKINIYSETDSSYVIHWEDMRSSGKEELRNIYAQSITHTLVSNIEEGIAQNYHLLEAYPNPFNPHTVIRYTLEANTNVQLEVYNLAGQLVEILVDNNQQVSGYHEIVWDASNFTSGIYFIKLKSNDFIKTKKITLLK
jgi:hypothetical protein